MIKKIDFDGYNEAEIHKMYEDGSCVCTVRKVEEEVTVKQDTNIILLNGVHFKLTKKDIELLTPKEISNENNE
jgi:hypothetical protein